MKSKITKRLILYFMIVIVVFSVISGIIMFFASRNSLEKKYISDLTYKTQAISESMSKALVYQDQLSDEVGQTDDINHMGQGHKYMGSSSKGMMGRAFGKNLLNWIEGYTQNDIKVIYKKDNFTEVGLGKKSINYEDLKEEEKVIIEQAFKGELSHKTWNDGDNVMAMAVSVPLYYKSEIAGAILLNDKVNFTNEIFSTAIYTFIISVAIGGILVAMLAIFFANKFIEPVNIITATTRQMIDGNYKVKNNIEQNDELGILADDIDELAIRLEDSKQQTKQLDELRDDFMSSISHELKTPVTVMKTSLEALNAGLIPEEEVAEYHEILYSESQVMERLIGDLMDLNSLRNSKYNLPMDQVNLVDILQDAIKSQRLLASEKSIEIVKEIGENYVDFFGDYTRLRQMFTTVINNAIKYSKEKSHIKIQLRLKGNKVYITVENYGCKIEEQVRAHVFEPFYRDKDNKEQGFGLGLAIAKEISLHHNIDLDLESNNEVTRFIFAVNKY